MDQLTSFFSEIMVLNLESIAVLFSILYVILVARENIWCWAAAIISVSLYIFICFEAKLYAETGLQVFYLIMAVAGYFLWKESPNKQQLDIKELSIGNHALILFVGIIFTLILGYVLTVHTRPACHVCNGLIYVLTKLVHGINPRHEVKVSFHLSRHASHGPPAHARTVVTKSCLSLPKFLIGGQ